jgi:protein subunit release factor B
VLNGRSQYQNKQEAFAILQGKLQQRMLEECNKDRRAGINRHASGFGHQVRTYRLDKKMVKCERTGQMSTQVNRFLDGDLELLGV